MGCPNASIRTAEGFKRWSYCLLSNTWAPGRFPMTLRKRQGHLKSLLPRKWSIRDTRSQHPSVRACKKGCSHQVGKHHGNSETCQKRDLQTKGPRLSICGLTSTLPAIATTVVPLVAPFIPTPGPRSAPRPQLSKRRAGLLLVSEDQHWSISEFLQEELLESRGPEPYQHPPTTLHDTPKRPPHRSHEALVRATVRGEAG